MSEKIQQIRQTKPEWSSLSDSQIVDMVYQSEYSDLPRAAVFKAFGVEPEAVKPPDAGRPLMSLTRGSVINDYVTEGVNALAGGISSAAKFVAPGNMLSRGIDSFIEGSQENLTDAARQGKQQMADDLEQAQGFGDEAKAVLKYAATNPGMALSQAVGSFVVPGAAVKVAGLAAKGLAASRGIGAARTASAAGLADDAAIAAGMNAGEKVLTRAGMAGGAVAGGAMAGGDAAGTAYELVLKAGGTPEQAEAAAREASVIPAAVGAAGGLVGAERIFAGAKGFAGGGISRALKTGAVEGAQEGLEEGITQFEGQRAAVPYDPTIDPMKGVAGAATLGAVLGGATGAGVSALHVPNNGPLSRAANTAIDIQHEEAKQVLALPAPTIQVTPGGTAVTPDQRGDLIQQALDARQGGIVDVTPIPEAPRQAPTKAQGPQEQIDQSLKNIEMWGRRAQPVPLEKAQDYKVQFAERGQDVTVIPHPTGQGFTVVPSAWVAPFMRNDVQQSELAGMLPSPDMAAPGAPLVGAAGGIRPQTYGDQAQSRAIQADQEEEAARKASMGLTPDVERAQVDRAMPEMLSTDIKTPKGNPFKAPGPVKVAMRKAGIKGDVIQVRGGWVGRPAAQTVETPNGITGDTAGVSGNPGDAGRIDAGAGLGVQRPVADGAERSGGVDTTRDVGSVRGADAGQPSGVRDAGGLTNVQDAPQAAEGLPAVKQAKPAKPKAADAPGAGQDAAGQPAGGVPAAGAAPAQADGVRAPVRLFASSGYQLTMADAVKKLAELEKDAREAKKRANSARTKFMQKVEDDASSRAAGLARQLRNDIKALADGYPDARQELDLAKQAKSDSGVARPGVQADGVSAKAPLFTRKLLPNMTDEELNQARDYYGPGHKRTEKIAKEIEKRAARKVPAIKESLSVEFGGKTYPVESMEDAQAKWIKFQETAGAGVSQVGNGVEVKNQAGKVVGRVSFNGRAWDSRGNLVAEAPAPKEAQRPIGQSVVKTAPSGARFRNHETGETWSGRGLQPKWILDGLASGKSLADFAIDGTTGPEISPQSEPAKGSQVSSIKAADDLSEDPEMAAYERGQTAETRAEDLGKVAGATGRRAGNIVDNGDVNPGEFIVRDAGTNLARFEVNTAGKATRVRFFFESQQTRNFARDAIDAFIVARASAASATKAAPKAAKAEEATKPSTNTIFTEDAAAKAREILRKKLGQMNSGLDPEMMQAGITLAGYHIEKGARSFAAYAKAMLEDLGDSVRPYLKSWYMGVKYDPRAAGLDGMSTAAEVESSDLESPTNSPVDQEQQPGQTADESTTSEQDDERRNIRGQSPQALDEVAAEDDSRPEGSRQVQRGTANRREERPADGAGVDAAGVSADRGRGSRAGAVRVPEARAGRGSDGLGDAGAGRARKAVPRADGRAKRPGSAESAVTPTAPNVPAQNFRISPDLRLGQGGEVEKFNDNLSAIRTLKTLEAERRRATADEQRVLARYVGWGGLANAFPDPMTGQFKDKWKARGEELQTLLTPKEYTDARRSTRNAHYTSEVVVSAMWDAARRLGFRGGLVLEDSMGTGNFLGLKPEDLPGKFIGVEYDNLTSRIAQALYPQAAVLNSGFQKVPVADNAFALNIGNPPFGSESLRFQFKPELQGVSIHNQFFRAGMDAVRPGGLQIKVVSRFLMDAQDKSTRVALARQADLVAAIRLPDTAFKENARTEVVTDIIILRKLTPAEQAEREAIMDAYVQGKQKDQKAERDRWLLADKAPAWVDVDTVRDPLGGPVMTVNRYFVQNPAQIMGVLERSGSMQHGADITVRLDDPAKLESMLREAVARLPEKVSNIPDEVLAATEERFSLLADALRIAVANEEVGHMKFDEGGALVRVIEREAPDGGYIMSRQQITEDSPWSEQLSLDDQGRWYKLEVEMGEDGKPVKATDKDGKATRRNVYKRTTYTNEADVPASMRLGKTGHERLKGLVELRDLLKKQLVLETEDAKPAAMEGNRKKLASAYEAFVAKHGPVNRSTNMALAMTMPDGGLVTALEVGYQPERSKAQSARSGLEVQSEKADPAPILRERVVPKYEPPTKAGTAADALAITLAERGRVDMERIASLRGVTPEAAVAELQAGDKPLVFSDPEAQTWETADAYLSGMVRRKLNAARDAAARDPRFDVNVKALEAVQPEAWTAENVTAQVGATWVPGDVYADFITSLVGGKANVSFSAITNSFTVSIRESDRTKVDQWSTDGAPADYIVNRLLNSQPVVVTYKDENGSIKVDQERTALAQLKGKEIVAEFGDWVFKDGDRRQRLVELFNEKFNTRVNRQFDGSHLKLPGKVPDSIIQMRRHQKNAIWRGIASRFLLLDHVVGAGKTFTGIARAMERRRMGLARKPMIVVPNHLVEQWAADVYRLYPGAKVLAAGQKDFEAKRRRRLFGKIATGDWDIVIVPHSSFGFIGISPETEMRYLEHEMEQAKAAIKEAEEQAEEEGRSGFRKPFGVKEAERLAEKIQARIDKLQSGTRDRLLTFEQLGVDDLTVDEAHEFKNLFYSSRLTGVRGMGDKTGSRKAADLYNKVRVMRENGGAVTFMTGTPISNSAVEMYTMMRYLAADELQEQGLEHFDAWRAQSVEASAAFEPTESGRLKEVTRLGRTWANMRALMDTYYGFTDAVSIEDIKKWFAEDNAGKPFPVPKVAGGDRSLVKVKPTPAQEAALKEIISGFDGLDGIKDPTERNAERLRLMDRARKVSLDIRAVDARATSQEDGGKLQRVSTEIKRIYDKWTPDRGTQLVFLDRSVPKAKGDDKIVKEYDDLVAKRDKALKDGNEEAFQAASDSLEKFDSNEITELRNAQTSGWNAYQQIKDNLVAMGIPAAEIRFVQEAQNDEQKAALFDAVRGGKVRVLIGSTPRMGAGTNVQDRLVGLHHVDVTWKPSDIEQREGRIIRQGNKLLEKYGPDFEVEIMAYATERTVDAKMWDLNAQKLRMINGIRKYDGAFSMEFEDEESVSMAEMAALASGNPLLLERVTIESQIGNLELQERAHRRKMYSVMDAIRTAERALSENPERIRRDEERGKVLAERVRAVEEAHAGRDVTVDGKTYTDQAEAMRAALAAVELQQEGNPNARYAITIDGKRATSKEAINDAIGAALGDSSPFMAKIEGTEYAQRTAAGRELARLVSEAKGALKGQETINLGEMFGYKLVADLELKSTARGDTTTSVDVHLVDGERTMATAQASIEGIVQMPTAQGRKLLEQLETDIRRRADYAQNVQYLQGQMERAKRDLPALLERKGEGFPKAEELAAKRRRLEEVVRELSSTAEANPDAKPAETSFSRQDAIAAIAHLDMVDDMVAQLTKGWKNAPKIEVLRSMDDAPEKVRAENERQKAGGAFGEPEAFFHDGRAYLLAGHMRTMADVRRAVFHETLGHLGLRGLYGDDLAPILDQVWNARRRDVQEKAKAYGLDTANMRDRRLAAEEWLAEIAQTNPSMGFVRRAVAAIRGWLRRNVPSLANLPMTDDEVIREFILPAQRFIKEGPGSDGLKLAPAFKRDDGMGFSRTAAAHTYAEQARNAFSDFVGSAGAQVDWLDKSLKTQYAKAQKFPEFGKVFNKLQQYIEGVSSMANQAADQAPSILPKLDTFSDLWKHGGILGHGLSKVDREAVAAPIFEGTLDWTRDANGKLVKVDDLTNADEVTPGVVFTPSELRDKFGLNDAQIGQYQEFRNAVNESLDQVVATELTRFIPKLPADIVAMAETKEGRQQMRKAVEEFLGGEDHPQWADVQAKYDKVQALKDRGYAPLSRFGKHFVHVVVDGETKFFGLEESRYKANALARELRQEFKGATVEQGVISQEQYKLMSAVPIDAMELFAEALGAEKSEVFQQYIQLAKNNRSTMKRLIHRKGTAGFSEDVPRVLANFITSNARASSAALHVKGAKDLAQGIRQGDVKDEAVKLIGSVTEPEESGAVVRNIMFMNFIGGSIASALVNVTQPVMMTLPYLSQWGGGVKAGARLIAAAKMAVTRKGGDDVLNSALKRAEDDGIVAPQEIHHLIQRAVGGMADKNPVLQKLAFVWGAPFSLAESFNRRATFIAAFQTAREEGIADPFAFAEKAVIETQGLYNSGNKPNAARGIAGATAMTFKQYSIHYLEWLSRMAKSGQQGKRAAVLALVMLMLAAGADGLPFMGDLDDVIDTAGQAMGYDTNAKQWRHKAIAEVLGDELGEVASRGFSAAGGMPIDVSVRMGMGNLIPATDLLMKSNTDTARSLAELAGPGGGLFVQYRDAVRLLLDGEVKAGTMKALPVALQNVGKAAEVWETGEFRDSKGRKVVDAGVGDGAAKFLGFQPADVARESGRLADMRQSEALAKLTESEITDKWARAIADGDKEAEKAALAMRDDWNEKNPEMPIVVKRTQAVRKARQLAMDRKARFLKTVAPERRQAAKQEMDS